MDSITRQYNVLIFSCPEANNEPNAVIHIEISGKFETFLESVKNWIRGFGGFEQPDHESRPKFRICSGEGEDIYVFCKEEEIILSLFYCCNKPGITVREISYQGNRYTDISDIRFLRNPSDERRDGSFRTYPIQLHAKKDGRDMQIYIFGPYICDFSYETVRVGKYPMSSGMVEAKENQVYAGAHLYGKYDWEEKPGDALLPVWVEEDVHVFLEIDGENVTFNALLDGKLHKKISKDEERVVFYSGLVNNGMLVAKSKFWKKQNQMNAVFKNIDGKYQLSSEEEENPAEEGTNSEDTPIAGEGTNSEDAPVAGEDLENRLAQENGYEEKDGEASVYVLRDIFIPPQTPDAGKLNHDSAYRLCRDYLEGFYVGSINVPDCGDEEIEEEYRERCARSFAIYTEELAVWEAFRDILEAIRDKYGMPEEKYVQPTEILYTACIFFSMEKEELDRFLTTEKQWDKYELLKVAVQNSLNMSDSEFEFSKTRQIFAHDFFELNRICGVAYYESVANYENNSRWKLLLQKEDKYMRSGRGSGYNEILSWIELAKMGFYNTSISDETILSVFKNDQEKMIEESAFENDQEKMIEESAEKDIDAVIAMRKDFREQLKAKVKGQDLAVDKFVDGYIRYQLRGKTPGKPAGFYLFAGPPGTGKTYLAEAFVEHMAKEGYQYKRFDMASYSGSSDSVTGLVGFEKTYQSSQPGQLTDFVRQNPKCVLLFDEIEKASPEVRYLFLSVLEGAVLTDKYYDEQVSFEDAILIFTTNEGKELYEDNRGTNLTAMSDSAVIEGLEASKFAPELLSRFASGTIIMFNHLSYFNMQYIFKASMDAAMEQIYKRSPNFEFHYGNELPKLYLLSKGGNIDARFVSANARKMVEDYFLEAMEYVKEQYSGSLKELKEIDVSVEVTDAFREYFGMTQKPRILGYLEGGVTAYTVAHIERNGYLEPKGEVEELCHAVDYDLADSEKKFKEFLWNSNWNSHDKKDRYDAVLIDLTDSLENKRIAYDASEGYACLKAAVEVNKSIPIIVVDRGNMKQKTSLMALGATDFVKGGPYKPQRADESEPDTAGWERESLALDREELKEILSKQHFSEMMEILDRKDQRISSYAVYDYEKESGKLQVCFTNLHIKAATEEDAETRQQNKKYLLADRPQVRLEDIFGNELMKKAVRRCIDNIKNPEKYREAGARLMKGILMYGAPGMGKTMVAKAMAYESGASFISKVGSDFLNGNGIDKMEEVFKTARRKKPCILFIDEFDAISQRRGMTTNAQELVLEKFLKEMDGLETDNEGVYVVGATNYSLEDLDSAVTRRFSAKINFPDPNKEERLDFLIHLLDKKGLAGKISKRAAKTMNLMMSGRMRNFGEIKTFIEESIAEAVFEGRSVTERFLYNRIQNETDGAIRKKGEIGETELLLVAYHEAGHAVLQYLFGLENEYVTIVSRGDYGGYAMAQSRLYTGRDFLEQICISFAGRAAEMRFLELSSKMDREAGINVGARSDLQSATQLAYDYVCQYGLDRCIMVMPESFAPGDGRKPEDALPEMEKEAIWTSVKRILERQWEYTRQQLQECWGAVKALAISLLYMQALDGEVVKRIIEKQIPYAEEGCFLDCDNDYKEVARDSAKENILYGYPVYPYAWLKEQLEEEDTAEADGKRYFYTVKKGMRILGLYEDLQEALTEAYVNDASCRRFGRKEAAQEYLEMLELRAFCRGGKRFWGISMDALTEMELNSAAVKKAFVLKEEEADGFREKANETGRSVAQYIVDIIEEELDHNEDFYMVTQIHDEGLKSEVLGYLSAKGLDEVMGISL